MRAELCAQAQTASTPGPPQAKATAASSSVALAEFDLVTKAWRQVDRPGDTATVRPA